MAAVYVMQKNLNTHEAECIYKFCEFLVDATNPLLFDKNIVEIATALGVVTITLNTAIPADDERFDPDYYEVTRIL